MKITVKVKEIIKLFFFDKGFVEKLGAFGTLNIGYIVLVP